MLVSLPLPPLICTWNSVDMYLNGAPAPIESIRSLALLNYGNFTSILVTSEGVRGLGLHLQRLHDDSIELYGTAVDPSRIRQYIRSAVETSAKPVVVRVTVFPQEMEIQTPGAIEHLNVLVTTRESPDSDVQPLRVAIARYQRELPHVKHIGLLGALFQRRLAQLDGFDDVLFVDEHSRVSEGATWNVGFFDGNTFVWPESPALPGVTERVLQETLKNSQRRPVPVSELATFQAAFATNAALGVRSIAAIGDIRYDANIEVVNNLRHSYDEVPTEEV